MNPIIKLAQQALNEGWTEEKQVSELRRLARDGYLTAERANEALAEIRAVPPHLSISVIALTAKTVAGLANNHAGLILLATADTLAQRRNDPREILEALRTAIDLYAEALPRLDPGSPISGGCRMNEANAWQSLARLGIEPEAAYRYTIELYAQAGPCFDSGSPSSGNCLMNEANTRQSLADLGIEPGANLRRAIALFTQALPCFEPGSPDAGRCLMNEANTRQSLAALGIKPGANLRQAIKRYAKALSCFEPGSPTSGRCRMNEANAWQSLARLGIKPEANLRRAIALFALALPCFKPGSPSSGLCCMNEANAWQSLADLGIEREANLRRAIDLFALALPCIEPGSPSSGGCLMNQAIAWRGLADLGIEPEATLRRAIASLALALHYFKPGSPDAGSCLMSLANTWRHLADLGIKPEATYLHTIDLYAKAQSCFEPGSPAAGGCLMNEAMTWTSLADLGIEPEVNYRRANDLYATAMPCFALGSLDLANAAQNKANLLGRLAVLGDDPDARRAEALELMRNVVMPITERVGSTFPDESERRTFRESRKRGYQLITALCLDTARAERNPEQAEALRWEAWQWVQRGKARTLQESMENLRLNDQPLSADQSDRFDALMEEFRLYDQSQPNPDGGRSQESAADHQPQWHQRVAALLASLVTTPKDLADPKLEPKPEPERAIPSLDEQHTTVVIEFFTSTEGRIGAFLHPSGAGSPLQEPVWLAVGADAVTALGQRQLAAIDVLRRTPRLRVREGRLPRDQGPDNEQVGEAKLEMLRIAAELGELLAPVRDRIAEQGWDEAHLLLCPTGALHLLPLAAADWDKDAEGRTRPWIAAHPLVHLPTVKLASDVLARVQSDNSDDSTPKRAYIAAADPWGRLQAIYPEAEHAADTLVANRYQVDYFPKQEAAIRTLREHGAQARVVHLAMHSGMHESLFQYCGVEFHDTRLTVLELLLRLRLMKAQLAVVATCSSNQPRELLADDPIVITRAWMVSGAASIIGSLWPLADEPAMQFSHHFYQAWAGDGAKGENPLPAIRALQQAILKVREDNPEDLYAWAPYTLVGHGGTMM